jgi:hypothetical protein
MPNKSTPPTQPPPTAIVKPTVKHHPFTEPTPDPTFSEVVLETETLNGIPVACMARLIKFETMVASLYSATRVHSRKESLYGNLPLATIFGPVISGCMCKGICHAVDIHCCIRILCNCLSRATFVRHDTISCIHAELIHGFSVPELTRHPFSQQFSQPFSVPNDSTESLDRVEKFIRLLNVEMYDWRGFVRKPLPKRAPYSLFDVDVEYSPKPPLASLHPPPPLFGFSPFVTLGCLSWECRLFHTRKCVDPPPSDTPLC